MEDAEDRKKRAIGCARPSSEAVSRQIRFIIKAEAVMGKLPYGSEVLDSPPAKKSFLARIKGCLYRKPTQVGERNPKVCESNSALRNSAKMTP